MRCSAESRIESRQLPSILAALRRPVLGAFHSCATRAPVSFTRWRLTGRTNALGFSSGCLRKAGRSTGYRSLASPSPHFHLAVDDVLLLLHRMAQCLKASCSLMQDRTALMGMRGAAAATVPWAAVAKAAASGSPPPCPRRHQAACGSPQGETAICAARGTCRARADSSC